MSIHGIEALYTVELRRGKRFRIDAQAEPLEGRTFRFKPGFTIANELGGYYAGELAMVAIDDDYPEAAPRWLPSGDLRPAADAPRDLVEQAQ